VSEEADVIAELIRAAFARKDKDCQTKIAYRVTKGDFDGIASAILKLLKDDTWPMMGETSMVVASVLRAMKERHHEKFECITSAMRLEDVVMDTDPDSDTESEGDDAPEEKRRVLNELHIGTLRALCLGKKVTFTHYKQDLWDPASDNDKKDNLVKKLMAAPNIKIADIKKFVGANQTADAKSTAENLREITVPLERFIAAAAAAAMGADNTEAIATKEQAVDVIVGQLPKYSMDQINDILYANLFPPAGAAAEGVAEYVPAHRDNFTGAEEICRKFKESDAAVYNVTGLVRQPKSGASRTDVNMFHAFLRLSFVDGKYCFLGSETSLLGKPVENPVVTHGERYGDDYGADVTVIEVEHQDGTRTAWLVRKINDDIPDAIAALLPQVGEEAPERGCVSIPCGCNPDLPTFRPGAESNNNKNGTYSCHDAPQDVQSRKLRVSSSEEIIGKTRINLLDPNDPTKYIDWRMQLVKLPDGNVSLYIYIAPVVATKRNGKWYSNTLGMQLAEYAEAKNYDAMVNLLEQVRDVITAENLHQAQYGLALQDIKEMNILVKKVETDTGTDQWEIGLCDIGLMYLLGSRRHIEATYLFPNTKKIVSGLTQKIFQTPLLQGDACTLARLGFVEITFAPTRNREQCDLVLKKFLEVQALVGLMSALLAAISPSLEMTGGKYYDEFFLCTHPASDTIKFLNDLADEEAFPSPVLYQWFARVLKDAIDEGCVLEYADTSRRDFANICEKLAGTTACDASAKRRKLDRR
jgi:hypothetical protein